MAMTVAAFAPVCVSASPDSLTETAVKRYFLAQADVRCHLLTPAASMAVTAGYLQARNASIRASGTMGALTPWLEQARAAAANAPCDAPQLRAAATQAQDAYRGFVAQPRLDLGDWTGDRSYPDTSAWRLAQYQSTSGADAVLGLYGTLSDARFVVMAHFADGARPYSARLLVRNADVVSAGLINRAPRELSPAAPLGFTSATTLSFTARDSADVRIALKPEVRSNEAGFSLTGGFVGKAEADDAVRFDLPTAAWRAMAPLDPREDVVVAFDCDDGPRYMRFTVGDFLTGLTFVRLPSPYGQRL
ncbi:hypothetical protein [Asticcacaulis solisilvae]|uniref:hypothetical protein n=1 Tax=Asticcacaulis solisilvae TaxID=1217274 RepID=UPI003FD85AF8